MSRTRASRAACCTPCTTTREWWRWAGARFPTRWACGTARADANRRAGDHPGPAAFSPSGLAGAFLERAADHVDHEVELVLAHLEPRGEAQRVLAAVDHAQAVLAQPLLGGALAVALELRCQFAGEQQAGALHLGDQAAELVLQRFQLLDRLAAALLDVLAHLRGDHAQHR